MAESISARDKLQHPTDSELLDRVIHRDKDALAALYDRYVRLVYSVTLRMVERPELAEEVVQDVFMALWLRGRSYQSERGPFLAWLLTITHNRCIDELRKSRRRAKLPTVEIDEVANAPSTPMDHVPDAALARLEREAILRALAKIPPSQKQVILMAYFQGLTQSEISEAMGEPLGTVKTRMRLGLQKLRALLAER